MSERALLWGIDGDLRGNEDRLMARLPILRFEDDGRLAVARTRQWSRAAERTLTWLASEEQAEEAGTRLDLPIPTPIESGQIVAVFGRHYRAQSATAYAQCMPILADELARHGAVARGTRTYFYVDDAVVVEQMAPEVYDDVAAALAACAKRAFDAAMRAAGTNRVPPEAEAALRVLRGTPGARLDDQIVRQLVVARLQCDADRYRRTLELGALRLHEAPETIERWVNTTLASLTPAAPTPALTLEEIEGLRRLLAQAQAASRRTRSRN